MKTPPKLGGQKLTLAKKKTQTYRVHAYPRKKSQIYSLQSRESERENPKRQKLNNPCCEGHHRQTARPDPRKPLHASVTFWEAYAP